MKTFPFEEYVSVPEFAKIHGVCRSTAYSWVRKGLVPYAAMPYFGRFLIAIRKNAPRPVKKTALPHWLHPDLREIPSNQIVIYDPPAADDDVPWHDQQVNMADLL